MHARRGVVLAVAGSWSISSPIDGLSCNARLHGQWATFRLAFRFEISPLPSHLPRATVSRVTVWPRRARYSGRVTYPLHATCPMSGQQEATMANLQTTQKTAAVKNGVNVQALLGAREALTNAPEAAQFIWRASC